VPAMVFSAAVYTSPTTGTAIKPREERAPAGPIVDHHPKPAGAEQAFDKHDVTTYTLRNAPLIGLAGLVAGLQEAFYQFERMPASETRQTLLQASRLYSTVGRKTLLGTTLGAVFCATEATLENYRHKHDSLNGMAGGAAAGLAFGMVRPWPQPFAWPLAFAGVSVMADVLGEWIPATMSTNKTYGPLEHRPNWNDPAPPRPPVLDTLGAARPLHPEHFWRGN